MMKPINGILLILHWLKPILKIFIPLKTLQRLKKRFIEWDMTRIYRLQIKPYKKEKNQQGINLVGNIQGDTGLGQGCRLMAMALEEAEIPYVAIQQKMLPNASMTNHDFDHKITKHLKYDINLMHVNANDFIINFRQMGKKVWDHRYTIAFWAWELEKFPEEWVNCIHFVDEIWTPSEFVSASIRQVTDKPVRTIPHPAYAPIDAKYDRKHFGLSEDKFLFFTMYDSGSVMERKNPLAVLEAFKKAFSPEDDRVELVIKISGKAKDDIEKIKEYFEGYTNIRFITGFLSKVEVNSLVAVSDVLVSLHRSEGFGLGMSEAMVNRTPCIATNWSGNTDFMNSEVACMVDYTFKYIEEDIGPFKAGNRWADANTDQAAEYMKRLVEDTEYYHMLQDKGYDYIIEKTGIPKVAKMVEERLAEIRQAQE